MSGGALPSSYQTDASPPHHLPLSVHQPSAEMHEHQSPLPPPDSAAHHAFSSSALGRVQQHFNEPPRDVADVTESLWGLPPWLVRIFFRIRNTLSIYNFFTVYCFNALLNTEIYREYMSLDTAEGAASAAAKGHLPNRRTMVENLYILTLMAPLADVLVRILARNFFKLNLAKSMSHASFTSSLAMCTPSLNTYALLLLRGSGWSVVVVLLLDIGEVVYSLLMWRLQQVKTEAMWIKLAFIVFTLAMFVWDVATLVQMRRFFTKLPAHLNPVYVCWDANRQFHWSSANSLLDVMVSHEDVRGPKFVSEEGRSVRKRIAEWNMDETALAHVAPGDDEHHRAQAQALSPSLSLHSDDHGLDLEHEHAPNGLANGTHSGGVSEEEEADQAEHKSLLSSRR